MRLESKTSTRERRAGGPLLAAICTLALAWALTACGGDSDSSTTTTTTTNDETTSTGGGGDETEPAPTALGPPEADETVDEAESRIADALDSKDCDQINELNLLSRPGQATEQRCTYLKRLAGLEVSGAKEYGAAGAVIDYQQGSRILSAVLVVDSDGLYHIAFLNPFNDEPTVGTAYAKEFDDVAEGAVKALEDGDCDAYQKVVFQRFGRGTGSEKDLCAFVKSNPISHLLEAAPDAKLEKSGGNDAYAFYTLGTPAVNLTLVLAREQASGGPPKASPLPKGAPKYAYVDAYRTNERDASE